MTSAIGDGVGEIRSRNKVLAKFTALVRGAGDRSRFQRLTLAAVATLRAAKRRAAKQALTVALAAALAFPSLNVPRFSEAGTGATADPAVATARGVPAVEMVLRSESSNSVGGGLVGRDVDGSSESGVSVVSGATRTGATRSSSRSVGGVGGRTAAAKSSRAAFIGPWSSAEEKIVTGPKAIKNEMVATAVKTAKPNRARGNMVRGNKGPATTDEGVLATLQSVAESVTNSGRDIAVEFLGHLKGAKRDVLVILLANALIIPLCKRVGLSPVLGFLAAGVVLGPNCLSVVSDVKAIEVLGEMGIVFFLFEMGLELSLSRLMAMKRDVFGLGAATFGVSAAAVAGAGYLAGLTGPQMVVIGGGVALSSSAFVLQLLRDRDDLGTRYGRACFGILLFQDLAVVPLLVAIPLLAGGGGGLVAALSSAATKAAIALGLIAFIGKNVLDRFFLLVAKSKSQEAFLAVILLTVIALSTITEGLGLSGTLGAFLAGTLLSETKYTPQVEADIAPFRALLLGMFFMTVGFEIDLALCISNLPLVASLVSGLLAMKAAVIAVISLMFGLSVANAQQTGLLLSQGGEFAFVAFGMAAGLGIIEPQLCKLLLTTVAISMAATPALSTFSAWVADQMEGRMGYDHYVGGDSESDEIRQGGEFVVVCGYGRIGRLVCELLGKKFINFVAFDNNPLKAMEARNRGLPVFYGDVFRPEVLNAFNVGKAKAVICTLSDIKGTNKAVVNLRREFPDLPIFARAKDAKHQKRLASIMDVVAMVPTLPEDSIIVSLPFGGAVLRSLGYSTEEVNVLLEDTRKKFVLEKGLENEEDDNLFEQLGISRSQVQSYKTDGSGGAAASEDGTLTSQTPSGEGQNLRDATPPAVTAVAAAAVVTPLVDGSSSGATAASDGGGGGGAVPGTVPGTGGDMMAGVSEEAMAALLAAESAALEEVEKTKALAAAEAAAALEAAVASGDVVYPTNLDKDAGSSVLDSKDEAETLAKEQALADEEDDGGDVDDGFGGGAGVDGGIGEGEGGGGGGTVVDGFVATIVGGGTGGGAGDVTGSPSASAPNAPADETR